MAKTKWVATTQKQVASFFGVSPETIKDWREKGCPGQARVYPLDSIVQWLRSVGPWRQRQTIDPDPMMDLAGSDSPNLERYRKAKAELAELELARQRADVFAARDVLNFLHIVQRAYVDASEILERNHGKDCIDTISEAIERAEMEANAFYRSHGLPTPDFSALAD